ncbi:MAG: hypothetical protein ACJAQT_002999 [Akkermansiaceae bacterium]|jgi:hypothetical protein
MKIYLVILSMALASSCLEGAVVIFTPPEPILFYREEDAPTGEVITPLDIDQNGSTDFQLGGVISFGSLIRPERSNKLLVAPATPPNLGGSLFPLQDNTMIGLTESPIGLIFISTDLTDGFVAPEDEGFFLTLVGCFAPTGCSGPFYTALGDDPLRAFIGFEFEIEGEVHYGYLDIGSSGAILNGWAYESEPGKAITTSFVPEPSFAMMAFLGMTSLLLRRRRS